MFKVADLFPKISLLSAISMSSIKKNQKPTQIIVSGYVTLIDTTEIEKRGKRDLLLHSLFSMAGPKSVSSQLRTVSAVLPHASVLFLNI